MADGLGFVTSHQPLTTGGKHGKQNSCENFLVCRSWRRTFCRRLLLGFERNRSWNVGHREVERCCRLERNGKHGRHGGYERNEFGYSHGEPGETATPRCQDGSGGEETVGKVSADRRYYNLR